ncbi:hypothetical protein [Thalassotalea litorea]|uniref:hypothetical protein n=1 Tax=Thalassotalea litorea TaxID=2020715 RepID=UPI0037362C49
MELVKINAMILALECGASTIKSVTDWADQIILDSDEPDVRLFDVSVAKNVNEAVSALRTFGPSNDTKLVAKAAFSMFVYALENNLTSYERVAQKIYFMCFEPNICLPDENAEGEMLSYWDSLDIANDGIYGDPVEIKKGMLAFLKQYEN